MQSTKKRDEARPVESLDELVEYFVDACKPRSAWRLGTEHEVIGVYRSGKPGSAVAYEGGIGSVLAALSESGWTPIREGDNIIALSRGDESVTIEPGGQLELASRPVAKVEDAELDVCRFITELSLPSRDLDIAWLAAGFRPWGLLEDVPWMPKGRYRVMREYLPTRGRLAHEMMKRTATVQVNIDYSDLQDAASKLRCAMSVTSILTAIYANSPIVDGKVSEFQTYRAAAWLETDPDRCGLLPFVFEEGDLFRRYAEWALDVPMFFVHVDDYVPANGMTFGQFMANGFQGRKPTLDDWSLHLSTLFPETRMKGYLEVRSCDSGSLGMVLGMAPLCRGLFYDEDACAAATALTADLGFTERVELTRQVPRGGLATRAGKATLGELGRELIDIAEAGLKRQRSEELHYLEPLREIVDSGRTQADQFIDLWERTGGDPEQVIPALAHPGGCD